MDFTTLTIERSRHLLISGWLLAAVLFAPPALQAAPDDEEILVEPDAQGQDMVNLKATLTVENFDRWVYQGDGGPGENTTLRDSKLNLQFNELERICSLTSEQRQKLKLAAAIDVQRFEAEVDEVRQRFLAVKDQEGYQAIWQEIMPLEQKVATGLHGEKSFFAKALRGMLSAEQNAKREAISAERRQFQYRASVEAGLMGIDDFVGLTDEQHSAIVQLMLAETKPPKVFGAYDQIVAMVQLHKLPETKMKPLMNEWQWKRFSARLDQCRGYEEFLIQQGILEK